MMRTRPRQLVLLLCVASVAATTLLARGKPEIHTSRGQLALEGYDAVAYFTIGRPTRGRAEHEHRWKDATWRFATSDHRDRFARAPERYAPQFGGYCAYAVSQGYTADGDPLVWRIVDGRLYVNYSRHAASLWAKDIPGHIAKAQRNWPSVLER